MSNNSSRGTSMFSEYYNNSKGGNNGGNNKGFEVIGKPRKKLSLVSYKSFGKKGFCTFFDASIPGSWDIKEGMMEEIIIDTLIDFLEAMPDSSSVMTFLYVPDTIQALLDSDVTLEDYIATGKKADGQTPVSKEILEKYFVLEQLMWEKRRVVQLRSYWRQPKEERERATAWRKELFDKFSLGEIGPRSETASSLIQQVAPAKAEKALTIEEQIELLESKITLEMSKDDFDPKKVDMLEKRLEKLEKKAAEEATKKAADTTDAEENENNA